MFRPGQARCFAHPTRPAPLALIGTVCRSRLKLVVAVAVVALAVLLFRTSGEADVAAPPVVVAEKEPPETKPEAAAVGAEVVAEQVFVDPAEASVGADRAAAVPFVDSAAAALRAAKRTIETLAGL